MLNWRTAMTQKELADDINAYKLELRERFDAEERRLAYVAITRAASKLFLSGSFWGGQKTARGPSRVLRELEEAGILTGLPEASDFEEDPTESSAQSLQWPLDPLGGRSAAVQLAATEVRQHLTRVAPLSIDPGVRLLLAEHVTGQSERSMPFASDRITASTFHEFIADPVRAARWKQRPLPQRPYRRTKLGNSFHEWVERRTSTPRGTELALWGPGDEASPVEEGADNFPGEFVNEDVSELQQLMTHFERSRWADLQPVAVELEITLPFAGRRLVCKLDAVYQTGAGSEARYEVIDWKSGRPPKNASERNERFFQLDLYRQAYASWAGIAPERIDVSLFYVSHEVELRGETMRTLDELEAIWLEAESRRAQTLP